MRLVRLALLAAVTSAAAFAQHAAPPPPAAAPAAPAATAPAAPTHVSGVIVSFAAPLLTVKITAGTTISVTLLSNARVIANQRASFNAIKPNDFVSTTVGPGRDGRLNAREVRIFPPEMRGLGEGRYPADSADRIRINAVVSEAATTLRGAGGSLKLTYHGALGGPNGACSGHAASPGRGACTGTEEVVVPPSAPVLQWVLGDPTWLEPGKAVSLYVVTGADGKPITHGVIVARAGIRPPR
jgi:hypothetical protein